MAQIVWIARHANRLDFVNPEWFNTAERRYDPPLSPDGEEQAKLLAKRLKGEGIGHIFASPFLRTVQTAHAVSETIKVPVKVEAGLSEWLNAEWMTEKPETLPIKTLNSQFSNLDLSYSSGVIPTYPETEETVFGRSALTAKRLAEEYSEDILLVGHGPSVLGAVLGLTNNQADVQMKVNLCCLFKLIRQGEKWLIELNGDTSHLKR
jgi:broad specificity phosphatase PhoE